MLWQKMSTLDTATPNVVLKIPLLPLSFEKRAWYLILFGCLEES